MGNYGEHMFTDAVTKLQKAAGSSERYKAMYKHRGTSLGEDETAFIQRAESFYIASISANGEPYIQHRGGARGFVNVQEQTLVVPDYPGNKQFITMGNLQTNDKVSLFFMDYLNKGRLKIQGQAKLVDATDAPELVAHLPKDPVPERVLSVTAHAFDWNCPKYIPTLVAEDVLRKILAEEITKLRTENERLKSVLRENGIDA